MIWTVFASVCASLSAFALAMEPHHRAVFSTAPAPRHRLLARLIGLTLLVCAFWIGISAHGIAHGLTVCAVTLGIAGFAVTLMLALWTSWLEPFRQSPARRKKTQTLRKDG